MRLTLPLAAAAAVAVSVASLFLPGGGVSVALADVQQRLAEIHTAQCRITISLQSVGLSETVHGTLQIKEPGRVRGTLQSAIGEMITITDVRK